MFDLTGMGLWATQGSVSNLPQGVSRHYVQVGQIRTHYLEAGVVRGPTVLLIHSGEFGGRAEFSWRYNIAQLGEHFHVYAPDLAGFGRTDLVYSFSDPVGFRLKHIDAFVRTMCLGPVHLMGNSFGGGFCLQMAVDPRFEVASVIAVSGGGKAPDNDERKVLTGYTGEREQMREILRVCFYNERWWADDVVEERWQASLEPGVWEACAAARLAPSGQPRGFRPVRPDYGKYPLPGADRGGGPGSVAVPDLRVRSPGRDTGLRGEGLRPVATLLPRRASGRVQPIGHRFHQAARGGGAGFMTWVSETLEVDGVKLGVRRHGDGAPRVILYGDQLDTQVPPFDDALAKRCRVLVPSLPGVNQSELPDWIDTMEDLAFLGLDLLESLDAGAVDVIGHGFGGWVAAEMAVRSQQHIRRLALIDSVGIKVSAPTVRDIQDVYVYTAAEVAELAWHDPSAANVLKWPGREDVEGDELLALLRNRQSVLKFAWRPFMYNPKLLRRLARVRVPAHVFWGESDRVVTPDYGRALQQAIPGAGFTAIPGAGHYPQWEQPEALARAVTEFLES